MKRMCYDIKKGNPVIPNKIIIWGKDGYNPLGLLRQLHGVSEVVFIMWGKPKYCAIKSRYCEKVYRTRSLEDGCQLLLDKFSNEESKPFIFATGDLTAEFIDQNKEILAHFFYIMGTNGSDSLSLILDKNYMNGLAEQCGFLIPKSIKCRRNTDIHSVTYPCLLKPSKNRKDHEKEFKTKRCDNKEELEKVLLAVDKSSCFVLQEYIQKQYDALIYGCRTCSGKVIIPGVLLKDRWDKGGDGSHGYLTPDIPQDISINAIESFLERIHYVGVFSVEFGICDDRAYFYEFNLRNDGTSHYFSQAGCNIPLLWIYETLGRDCSSFSTKLNGNHNFIAIFEDFVNVIYGRISYKQWKQELMLSTVFRYYDKQDMKPFYYNMGIIMLRPLRNILKSMSKKL